MSHHHPRLHRRLSRSSWMYPPNGETRRIQVDRQTLQRSRAHLNAPKHLLGQWPSTAICGNDILASVLYSSGIVAVKAGKLTPLAQLLVALVLYLFRSIYEEAVTAVPLNGGSYNVLLNTTSKRVAAVAASLGIISYLTTGVVSGTSAMRYLDTQVDVQVVPTTVLLLFVFALLSIIGIAESATVALVIFVVHVMTLTLLSGFSIYYAVTHPKTFWMNLKTEFPDVNVAGDIVKGKVLTGIFFGYSSAMLGITGFETSAQFVEEQAPGVFRKTLRNMWAFATVYNVMLSILSLAVLPLEGPGGIYDDKDVVLATMGKVVAGPWLESWVSIDAFVVLSGGVLTSYVGITGLVRRLAFDRVLPAFLTRTNKWRGTNHYIILQFFALQASLVILLHADATVLAGVFTFAFLGVMALFAFGCILLKLKRGDIPRDVHAPWWSCIFGLVMVLLGLMGNLFGDPTIFIYFSLYFIVFVSAMFIMLERVFILRIVLYILKHLFPSRGIRNEYGQDIAASVSQAKSTETARTGAIGGRTITAVLKAIHLPPIVFFLKTPDLSVLNKAILYVRKNEHTHNLRVIHVSEDANFGEERSAEVTDADVRRGSLEREDVEDMREMARVLDLTYPKIKIDFVHVCGSSFDNALIHWLSDELDVPPNMMFVRQPGTKHIHQIAALGVRVITG
uniref:Amino acid permease/ SLC12A domain-containing protein n=1 Tax=Hyaloperonospora arabidopsidis (strain Emoy2) TaxID=559515 RepID=M4BZE2_HYAAE